MDVSLRPYMSMEAALSGCVFEFLSRNWRDSNWVGVSFKFLYGKSGSEGRGF